MVEIKRRVAPYVNGAGALGAFGEAALNLGRPDIAVESAAYGLAHLALTITPYFAKWLVGKYSKRFENLALNAVNGIGNVAAYLETFGSWTHKYPHKSISGLAFPLFNAGAVFVNIVDQTPIKGPDGRLAEYKGEIS